MFSYRIKIERPSASKAVEGYVFEEATITTREIRSWPDEKLHIIAARATMGPAAASMINAEQRRREAWKAPAGAAFWISCAALFVSVFALGLSALTGAL